MNKTRNLFKFASDIEAEASPLDEVNSVLCLLEEQIRSTAEWLDPSQPHTAVLVKDRCNMLLDMLSMIRRDLEAINKGIYKEITNAYRQYNAEKQQVSN